MAGLGTGKELGWDTHDDDDQPQTLEDMEALYQSYSGAAYGLAFQLTRETTAAEDVVQEAFLSLWRSRQRYDATRGTVKTWLLTIVRNRAIDRLRHDRLSQIRTVELDSAEVLADATADPGELKPEQWRIRQALEALPLSQREAITLAFFGGYSHGQIAELRGLPLGTVKSRLRLGLEKLSSEMAYWDAAS